MANCQTFSSLALTEDRATLPAATEFTLTCSAPVTQALSFTLSPTNGIKTMRLWALDASGNVSLVPQSLLVTLDDTPPTLNLTSMNSGILKGGAAATISWTASDSGAGVSASGIDIRYSTDAGSTWNTVSLGLSNSGTYSWTVPAVDSSQVRIKVTATDNAGNITSVVSASVRRALGLDASQAARVPRARRSTSAAFIALS